jgi:hypothetical protein
LPRMTSKKKRYGSPPLDGCSKGTERTETREQKERRKETAKGQTTRDPANMCYSSHSLFVIGKMAVCGVSKAGCACGVGSGGCSQEHCKKVCPDPIAFPRKSLMLFVIAVSLSSS